jgi:hypothetical protein
MVNGESHYYLGRRYRLRVIENAAESKVVIRNPSMLELHVRPGATRSQRARVLQNWYREQLKGKIPALIEKWQLVAGVKASGWGIKKMKTKWGSCNAKAGRIWLNLELAKKPVKCVEYIIAHELAHLKERRHNERFLKMMDRSMPRWRVYREELNRAPLGHDSWGY